MDFTVQVLYRRMPSQKISSNHVIFKKYVNNEFLWKNQCWVNEHLHFLVWILSDVEWRTIQFLLLRWQYAIRKSVEKDTLWIRLIAKFVVCSAGQVLQSIPTKSSQRNVRKVVGWNYNSFGPLRDPRSILNDTHCDE